MDENTFRAKLLQRDAVTIQGFRVKQFTIKEITRFGIDRFNSIRNFVWYDVHNLDKQFKEHIDIPMTDIKKYLIEQFPMVAYSEKYTVFDLICYEPMFNKMFTEFLNTFTSHMISSVQHMPLLDSMNITYDDTNVMMVKRSDFKEMMNSFTILNFAVGYQEDNVLMQQKEKSKDVEDFEAEVEDMLKQFGFKKEKPKVTLYSIIEWLVNDGHGYTHENICYRTIYQVLSSYNRRNHMEYCESIEKIRCNGMLGKMDKKDLEKATPSFEIYR